VVLLVGEQEGHPACVGTLVAVIRLEFGADDLHVLVPIILQ